MTMIHNFRLPTRMLTSRLLVIICLLLTTAEITFSQADPSLSVKDAALVEADQDFFQTRIEINLSAPSAKTVSVVVSTQPGTALSSVDFVAGAATLTFQPGQTVQTIDISATGDTLVEGTEEFFLNLSNPVNATIADGQAVLTIIDDDALLVLTQPSSQRAAALDSPLFTKENFPIISSLNFSSDNRTRVAVFAIGLKLAAGETASAVTATAEDSQGGVRPLTVEFVGKVPNFFWLTQVVLKLNDQIPTPGDVKIRITLHGETSNAVLIGLSSS